MISSFKNMLFRVVRRFQKVPHLMEYIPKGDSVVVHISAFSYGNAGDTYLPVVLRDLFNNLIGVRKWIDEDVHSRVTSRDIRFYNEKDYIVIGGGGLFLSDTCPNETSGWQWNCSIEALEQIKCPIIAFALGYNRFRGQEDFKPIFTEHLNKFVEKASFVGIRNKGSIVKLSGYLKNDNLKAKLVYQPCMTTLTSKVYPTFVDYSKKEDFIALNCAFDRKKLRSSSVDYLKSIARVMLKLSKITKIKVYAHMKPDLEIEEYLKYYNVPYEVVNLVKVEDIVSAYACPRVVVGMRGHAQMIPFGCQTAIVSIISHDKMQWFLDDIGHPDWGADVLDVNFEDRLLSEVLDAYYNYTDRIQAIKDAQENLWEVTKQNIKFIRNIIK